MKLYGKACTHRASMPFFNVFASRGMTMTILLTLSIIFAISFVILFVKKK